MRPRSLALVATLLSLAAAPVVAQQRPAPDLALATLCTVRNSLGPLWAGASVGCPVVLPVLPPSDRPCRTRYTTGAGTREEARLHYDDAGRLREVEHPGRSRARYVYDRDGRLTSHTRQTVGYPASTTTFTWTADTVTDDTPGSDDRTRWHLDGGRAVSWETIHGAPDALPMAVSQAVLAQGIFAGVDTTLCRRNARTDARCESDGTAHPSRLTRDRAGHITRLTNEAATEVFTWDARGRLARIRSTSPRFHDETLVDYVCPTR